MSETYKEMKARQDKEFNAFPLGAAFSDKQFEEQMREWGLDPKTDTDKLYGLGAGCFIQKKDADEFHAMFERFENEKQTAIDNDESGEFCRGMFAYELGNYECWYTGDPSPALEALGLTMEQVNADERLSAAFSAAWSSGFDN